MISLDSLWIALTSRLFILNRTSATILNSIITPIPLNQVQDYLNLLHYWNSSFLKTNFHFFDISDFDHEAQILWIIKLKVRVSWKLATLWISGLLLWVSSLGLIESSNLLIFYFNYYNSKNFSWIKKKIKERKKESNCLFLHQSEILTGRHFPWRHKYACNGHRTMNSFLHLNNQILLLLWLYSISLISFTSQEWKSSFCLYSRNKQSYPKQALSLENKNLQNLIWEVSYKSITFWYVNKAIEWSRGMYYLQSCIKCCWWQ